MSKVKLNQIVALNSGKKTRLDSVLKTAYHNLQKSEPFNGHERVYHPKDDDGEKLPNESKKVQLQTKDILDECQKVWSNTFDVVLTNDAGNCQAKGDIIIDGKTLMKDVPVTTLLYLEKRLDDFNTLISKLPTLSLSDNWTLDNSSGLYTSNEVQTVKTKKTQRPIVLYDATKEHPAQTNLITEDVPVGMWNVKQLSSAYPITKVSDLLDKVAKLKEAVVKAREQANSTEIEQLKGGQEIVDFIFG